MRIALALGAWLACASAGAAEAPFLSKGYTFDEAYGAAMYAHVCVACHQADGSGAVAAGSYPALKGDEKLASTDYVLDVLIGGLHAMPPLGAAMSDTQVADVVNFVRSEFADARDDLATPARAAAVRAALNKK